jgi:four helix bundle protein
MEKPFDIRDRSFLFALDVVKFAQIVADRGWIMSRLATQLVDSGGSVGANLQEAEGGQTKPDFHHKELHGTQGSPRGSFLASTDRCGGTLLEA